MSAHTHQQARVPRRNGSVLIIVLVTLMVASFALTLFIEKAGDDLLVETREVDARRLRAEAYSALETTLAVLNEFKLVNGTLRSPAEGWGDPLEFAAYEPGEGRRVTVAFEDESGKLSLPRMTPSALVDLFVSWELSQSDAEQLSDALLEWCKEDHVPASGFSNTYEQDEIPFGAPRRSLRTWSELASIDLFRELLFDEGGQPNERWRQLVDSVSLLDFSDTNVNAARPGVLSAVGLSPSQQTILGDYLSGKTGTQRGVSGVFKSSADAASLVGTQAGLSNLGAEIRALRILITVEEGRSRFRLNVVVSPGENGAKAVTNKARPANRSDKAATASNGNATGTGSTTAGTGAGTRRSSSQRSSSRQDSSLNYPFTVLEIRENDAIPQTATSPEAIPSHS